MANERASEERDTHFGNGIVAVLPHSAVERVHVFGFSGKHSDVETAADHFAIGGQVGTDSEERLHAAGVSAEAGYNLIEDESHAGLLRDGAKLAQELDWL